jgi:hypothetical protein
VTTAGETVTRMAVWNAALHRTFEDLLRDPGVRDQVLIPYRLGRLDDAPAVDEDPGRIRSTALFIKMYGDCRSGAVQKQLARVAWLRHRAARPLLVTSVNGVAEKLAAVSEELEAE